MTQHRRRAARQHGRNAMAIGRQHAMPHGIHPSVHAVQPSAHAAVLRCAGTEAKTLKLRERHDTMLSRRQLGQRRPQRGWTVLAKVSFANSVHPSSLGRIVIPIYAGVLRMCASPSKIRPTPGRSPGESARWLQRTMPSGPTMTRARLVMPPGSK